MSQHVIVKAIMVCNEHKIAHCGLCAEQQNVVFDQDVATRQAEYQLCNDKNPLRRKHLKRQKSPSKMDCNCLSVAELRQQTLTKLAQFASLRNDKNTLQQLNNIIHLVKNH
jgi:hypothetical protein